MECTRGLKHLLLFTVSLAPLSLFGAWITWTPEKPGRDDVIQIEVRSTHSGVLHWGVNAQGKKWNQAIEAYRPAASEEDGVATRTRLTGPDSYNICRIKIGPFNNTNQIVGSVDFAFQWDDKIWDTHGGQDYHIPIYSKRITWEPATPDLNQRVAITVHNSTTNGMLRWGVNAQDQQWMPPHPIYWPKESLLSDDGLAIDSPLPPPDAEGNSTLWLGPFQQGAQAVTSLHMAVHWNKTWDTDFGRNYHTEIQINPTNEPPQIIFTEPVAEALFTNSMTILLQSNDNKPVHLWLDGKPLITFLAAPWEWTCDLTTLRYGPHQLVAKKGNAEHTRLAHVSFWRVPSVLSLSVEAGFPMGAQECPDNTVGFALYAPHKKFVSVIGDFNNWDPEALFMQHFGKGTWWVRYPMTPGKHQYQYLIDGSIRVADPYSQDVEWKDKDGKEAYLPEDARTVIHVGAKPYSWKATHFERPPLNKLIIYEFFIEDFCPGEGFTGVTARLDYFKQLGVNAIEPLPFTEYSGEKGWGYNPSFHFAPESSYGTPDELKELIDEAHLRGIAVIFDMVLNHTGGESALHQLYGTHDNESPYYHLFLGENWGMPDLDQESPHFKKYVSDLLSFWTTNYFIDGFRYDATRWVGWQGYNDWGASWFAYAAHQADPSTYQIAEHLPIDPELMNTTEMDAGWHAHFRWRLREMIVQGTLNTQEFERIMSPLAVGFSNSYQRVTYVESHDEERLMNELLAAEYPVREALRRAEMGIILSITTPGIPMIYAGQEFGEDTKRVVGVNPLHWEQLNNPKYRSLFRTTLQLIKLKTQHPALHGEDISFLLLDEEKEVAAFERRAGRSSLIVAANFNHIAQKVALSVPFAGQWSSVLTKEVFTAMPGQKIMISLEPGQAKVLTGTSTGKEDGS